MSFEVKENSLKNLWFDAGDWHNEMEVLIMAKPTIYQIGEFLREGNFFVQVRDLDDQLISVRITDNNTPKFGVTDVEPLSPTSLLALKSYPVFQNPQIRAGGLRFFGGNFEVWMPATLEQILEWRNDEKLQWHVANNSF